MLNATVAVPLPVNEPIRQYAPGSTERAELKAALNKISNEIIDIPALIDGREVRSGQTFDVRMPHRHQHVLAKVHSTDVSQVEAAIAGAMKVKAQWANTPFHERAAIFLRAAELLTTKYRWSMNACTMAGQSKTAYQAEIDAACEAIDFLRFNVAFAEQLQNQQPVSSPGMWNQTDYRPLDGFVFAVAPFNFTAIALNLATAPALMGNVVLLKPAETASLSSWHIMQLLKEAGVPDGVIQFLPGNGATLGPAVMSSPDLGGIHFTGSTAVFNSMWKTVGDSMSKYRQYPRIVGETGGKDFIFVHNSAAEDADAVATAIVRGGFEFQGQKCSACSRVFVPQSMWPSLKQKLIAMTEALHVGDVADFRNFMSAVIDEKSFNKIASYIELGKQPGAHILAGGTTDRARGWFVKPTLIEVNSPTHRLMTEEIFGPVVSVFVYPDAEFEGALKACDAAAAYALTGAVFARDRKAINTASTLLRHAAGNFYINDKCTGAVVGQQPFGGSRASGTNDKAGSMLNLVRWVSPRTIKETFNPPTVPGYPFMQAE